MKRQVTKFVALAVSTLLAGVATAENKFDYCLLCHGANGNGNYGIRAPKISGMESWYLARQLDNFAAGIRGLHAYDEPGQEMAAVGWRVKQDGALDAAVTFVASLESKRPAPTLKGNVTLGKALYAACANCHGAKGEGNPALQAPALAARSDWYLATQLANYRNGLRGADARDTYGAQMRAAVAMLPDDKAVTDVVAYINTL